MAAAGRPGEPGCLTSPGGELGFRLSRLARALRRRWAAQLAPLGLSPPQAAILRALAGEPGSAVRAIARTLGSDPMNVKRCVDDLQARGLVRSGSQPGDRRLRALSLTDRGERLAGEVIRLAREHEAWLAGAVHPDGRQCLERALGDLERLLAQPPAERAPDPPSPALTGPPAPDGHSIDGHTSLSASPPATDPPAIPSNGEKNSD